MKKISTKNKILIGALVVIIILAFTNPTPTEYRQTGFEGKRLFYGGIFSIYGYDTRDYAYSKGDYEYYAHHKHRYLGVFKNFISIGD